MSREVIADPLVGVPRPRASRFPVLVSAAAAPTAIAPTTPRDAEPAAGSLDAAIGLGALGLDALGLDPVRPDPVRPAPPRRWVALMTVALLALLAGAAVGDTHARRAAQDQLLAGTRVLLWADGTELPGDGDAESADLSALPVTLVVAGSPVTVLRLLLGAGEADASPALVLRPGVRVSADLKLHPDCVVLGRDGGHPAAFATARAVVRMPGESQLREVPLDVLGDPSAVTLSLLAPCTADNYGVG
jgi:hypothetical protein